jgi:aminoglycoside 6'-N-acetyltransferase
VGLAVSPSPDERAGGRQSIGFRPLERADFAILVDWLGEESISRWWGPSLDREGVEREYGPAVGGGDPTEVFVVLHDGEPAGLIQTYLLDDHPDYAAAVGVARAAGVDLLISEAHAGGGFGSRVLARFVDSVVWAAYPAVERCMGGPSEKNRASVRAFEKAGFVQVGRARVAGEEDLEAVMVRERP